MTVLLILISIWVAGGFAAIGALKGISVVEETQLNSEVYTQKFLESWYAFGQILTILLAEIGKQIIENKK